MLGRSLTRKQLLQSAIWLWAALGLVSCSLQPTIPTVADDDIERLVYQEAAQIIAVSEDRGRVSQYRLALSDFPRRDILGMSIGHRRIYISHRLAALAVHRPWYRWLLRQTLAHEIAHETAGHATRRGTVAFNRSIFGPALLAKDIGLPPHVQLRNYSTDKELEADLKGMSYWRKLNWNCEIWVKILENFREQKYAGDIYHPTDKRLDQAQRICARESRPSPADRPARLGANPLKAVAH